MQSYENGGEVLGFDPQTGLTDVISLPEPDTSAIRVGDELWRTTENGGLLVIDNDGNVTEQQLPAGLEAGALIGYVDDYVWMVVEDGLARVNPDGLDFEVMAYQGAAPYYQPFLSSPREVVDGDGAPWLLDVMTNTVVRIDEFSADGQEVSSVPVGRFPHSAVSADGYLWVTSYDDYTLSKINPETLEVETVTPFPGRPSGVQYADGSLWVFLYQSGFLVRIDPGAELQNLQATIDEVVTIDDRQLRLRCSGAGDPLVILDADVDLGAGSWSVVQAGLSANHEVCSFDRSQTYTVKDGAPAGDAEQLTSDLMTSLGQFGLADREIVYVAHGEGVADAQAFVAQFGGQVDGLVLVDPAPAEYAKYADDTTDRFPYEGSGDFGDRPLVVIGHDMKTTFLSQQFIAGQGEARSEEVSTVWQEGLDGYAALSTNSSQLTADGSNHNVPWESPQMIIDAVQGLFTS
jgi:streptogramin lyase